MPVVQEPGIGIEFIKTTLDEPVEVVSQKCVVLVQGGSLTFHSDSPFSGSVGNASKFLAALFDQVLLGLISQWKEDSPRSLPRAPGR